MEELWVLDLAIKRAEGMISDGVDIIDLGERVPGLEPKKFHWKKSGDE